MMSSVKPLESLVNHLNWTMDPFDAGPTFYQSQSTAENWSPPMPEFQFNQSNSKKTVPAPFYLTSGDNCFAAFNGIVILILCAFGFLTNLVTIFGLRRDPEKDNATIWLLKTLAVVDNVHLSFRFVVKLMETIAFYSYWSNVNWLIYYHIAVGMGPLFFVGHDLSVWIVVLVTVARYLCIIRPMDIKWRNLRRMKVAVMCLLILAVLFNIPTFLWALMSIYYREKCIDSNFQILTPKSNICITIERFLKEISLSFAVLNSVIGSFIPFISLIILNLRIALALRTLKEKRRQMSLQIIRERSLTKTLVIVVGAFAVCQIPNTVLFFIYRFIGRSGDSPEKMLCSLGISTTLIVLNSPINFLIYCLFSKRFKEVFMGMLSCHKLQRRDVVPMV